MAHWLSGCRWLGSRVPRGVVLLGCVLFLLADCGTLIGLKSGKTQGACTTDTECAPDYSCLIGTCRNTCNADAQCGDGARCLKAIGSSACIPASVGCDDGCPEGTKCDGAACRSQCSSNDECWADQLCVRGACISTDPSHEVGGAGGGGDAGASSSGGASGSGTSGGDAGSGDSAAATAGAPAGGSGGSPTATGGAGGMSMSCQPNPAPSQCSGNTPQFCAATGEWANVATGACTDPNPACVLGVCTSCKPSATATQCDGSTPQHCDDTGHISAVASGACNGATPVCLGGACVTCTPNATPNSCRNSTPQFCNASGAWQDVAAGACAAGVPTCSNGSCSCMQTVCGSACVNLNSDGANCGKCGHSCLGGTCSAGKCQPIVLASGQSYPTYMALNSKAVFWLSGSGIVTRVNTDGTGLKVLVTATSTGYGIAADETNVFYCTDESYGVGRRVPVDGGSSAIVVTGIYSPQGVTLDSTRAYFSAYDNPSAYVLKNTPAGGGSQFQTNFAQSTALLANGSYVYYGFPPTGLKYQPVPSGTAGTAADYTVTGIISHMAWYNSNIVFTTGNDVRQYANSAVTVIAPLQNTAWGIAADASGVYWTSKVAAGSVLKIDAGGQAVVATGQDYPSSIAVDDKAIYWSNSGATSGTGAIMKLAK